MSEARLALLWHAAETAALVVLMVWAAVGLKWSWDRRSR